MRAGRLLAAAALVGVVLSVAGCSGGVSGVRSVGRSEVGSAGSWFEPVVAVDGLDPRVVAVAVMEAPRPGGHVRLFVSRDGGGSWVDRGRVFGSLEGESVGASGDATVGFVRGVLVVGGLLVVGDRSVVAVARSSDLGVSFATTVVDRSEVPLVRSGPRPPPDRLDKPWVSVSVDGLVGVVWAHQRDGRWELRKVESSDAGVSFGSVSVVEADGGRPQFGVVAPGEGGGFGPVVWTRDGAEVVAREGLGAARVVRARRDGVAVGPVVVDGRAGRDACWSEAAGREVSLWCASLGVGGAGPVRVAGEGLPAVVSVGGRRVLASVRVASGRVGVRVRVGDGRRWSAAAEVVSWATGVEVCVAGCESESGGDRDGGDGGVPEIGDYHGVAGVSGGVLVVTVEPGASGASRLWTLRVAVGA